MMSGRRFSRRHMEVDKVTSDGSPGYKPPDLVRALSDAVKSINSGASVEDVLEQIVKSSRQILDARYGAVAILRPDSTIAQFVVDGLEPEEIEKIGDLPRGRGMLGAVIESGAAIRSPDISRDPRRSGFPPGHPPMKSFLGVPIRVDGQIMGTLYLTDKRSAESFSSEDEWIAGVLAEHAGIAVHKARLLTARETFISIAAHELRTPVGAAQLAVETAIERGGPQAGEGTEDELLLDVKRYIEDLSHEIEDLLDASRLEHGTFRLRRRQADLREICAAACSRMEWAYGEERIRRHLGDDPIPGRWDGTRLEMAVANILENALRFSGNETTVDIYAESEAGRATISIVDKGPGIAGHDLPHIWNPYTQGASLGGDHHGAGIGLFVVREIEEAHAGTVTITSALTQGTTVAIELPLAATQ